MFIDKVPLNQWRAKSPIGKHHSYNHFQFTESIPNLSKLQK